MPQVISLYKCARCGKETEWDFNLGHNPLCVSCWDSFTGTAGMPGWAKRKRRKEIIRLFTTEGKGVEELALRFGVSQRTVHRALQTKEVKV